MLNTKERSGRFKVDHRLTSPGVQSEVHVGVYDKNLAIRKKCGLGLERNQLRQLSTGIQVYRLQLQELGIKMPENYSLRVTRGEKGHIEMIDEFIMGRTVDEIVRQSPTLGEEAISAWGGMVDVILKAQGEGGHKNTKVMLDAKAPNFLFAGQGQTYYIDLFPPLLRDNSGLVSPYIPEVFKRDQHLMSFNFGDIRGMLTKLLALTRYDYPDKAGDLIELSLDLIRGKVDANIEAYVNNQAKENFPDMNTFYSGKADFTAILLLSLISYLYLGQ